jgi:hypothetical protein
MTTDDVFVFSEVVRCGVIGKIAYKTFHAHHTMKLHLFGRSEDFTFIDYHPNNVFHILEDDSDIVKAFNAGHKGTAMVWSRVILDRPERYIVHFDSDVVFRGNIVDDICQRLREGHTLVGPLRNYPNNPNKRDDVRHLPDITQTYCFGFNKEKNYIKDYELLVPVVQNALTTDIVMRLSRTYQQYRYVPTIDFFDPLAFILLNEGGSVCLIKNDCIGGTRDEGDRINKYGNLNAHLDFGDKISHFASVGSGLNFLHMIQKGQPIQVEEWYVKYALGKLDLYMRIFYKTSILADGQNEFLIYEAEMREAFRGVV